MADNIQLVGKWSAVTMGEDGQPIQSTFQLFKDGSCSFPVGTIGNGNELYFYQAFENGTIKFDSGLPEMNLYRYILAGDRLTIKSMTGDEFNFVKEEKKSKFKFAPDLPAKPVKAPEPEREPTEDEWKCEQCGKINMNFVGTCGCGAPRPAHVSRFVRLPEPEVKPEEEAPVEEAPAEPEKPAKPAVPEREAGENEWKCPKCGVINQNYVGTCGCGEPKPAHIPPYIPKYEVKREEEPKPVEVEEEKKPAKPAVPEREAGENEWKCPNCGVINQNYVGTCGCGEAKPAHIPPYIPKYEVKREEEPKPVEAEAPKKPEKPAVPEREAGENEWKCPKCGVINQNYVGTCGCGEAKPAHIPPYIPKYEVKREEAPKPIETAPAKAKPEKPGVPERVAGENEWKCSKCGVINQNYVGTCGCGQSQADNN